MEDGILSLWCNCQRGGSFLFSVLFSMSPRPLLRGLNGRGLPPRTAVVGRISSGGEVTRARTGPTMPPWGLLGLASRFVSQETQGLLCILHSILAGAGGFRSRSLVRVVRLSFLSLWGEVHEARCLGGIRLLTRFFFKAGVERWVRP